MINFSNVDIKELAGFICESLKDNGIDAVLVGGACVSIYSHNRYQSYDLDFASYNDLKSIEKILGELGFRRSGRSFSRPDCSYLIDFVNPPIAIGHESIRSFEILKTVAGSLTLLTATDCVKDRLAAFFHWNDEQAFEQALLVAKEHAINLPNIKRWAKIEGYQEKLKQFLDKLLKK